VLKAFNAEPKPTKAVCIDTLAGFVALLASL